MRKTFDLILDMIKSAQNAVWNGREEEDNEAIEIARRIDAMVYRGELVVTRDVEINRASQALFYTLRDEEIWADSLGSDFRAKHATAALVEALKRYQPASDRITPEGVNVSNQWPEGHPKVTPKVPSVVHDAFIQWYALLWLDNKLDLVLHKLDRMGVKMSALDDKMAEVDAETTAVGARIDRQTARISDLVVQLAAAQPGSSQATELQAQIDRAVTAMGAEAERLRGMAVDPSEPVPDPGPPAATDPGQPV